MIIRQVSAGDAAAIEGLYAACMAIEPGIGPVTQEQWAATISLPQFGGGRDFLVAECDGTLVGLAESSLRNQDTRWIRHLKLVVDPARRRRGVGAKLLREVLAQGPEDPRVVVQCNVSDMWAAGLAFVARFGFSRIEAEITMRCHALTARPSAPAGVAIARVSDVAPIATKLASLHNEAFQDDAGMHIVTGDDMSRQGLASKVWIAAEGTDVVGFAFIEPEQSVCWLESLAVAPWCQGRGIGAALAAAALRGEGAGGDLPAGLSVSSSNPRAFRLYESLGFVRLSEKLKFGATRDSLRLRCE